MKEIVSSKQNFKPQGNAMYVFDFENLTKSNSFPNVVDGDALNKFWEIVDPRPMKQSPATQKRRNSKHNDRKGHGLNGYGFVSRDEKFGDSRDEKFDEWNKDMANRLREAAKDFKNQQGKSPAEGAVAADTVQTYDIAAASYESVKSNDDSVIVCYVEMPGVSKEDVDISVCGQHIHVYGIRNDEMSKIKTRYTFLRRLSTRQDPASVKATMNNGVVCIEIGLKAPESTAKRKITLT
jgi:HSP20 family molecular chaperone IbpA